VIAYLDTSILVSILLEEASSARVIETLARRSDAALVVSDLAAAEVSSAVSLRVRRGEDSAAVADARLESFDRWRDDLSRPVEVLPDDIRAADRIVRMFDLGLRPPDATHAAVARRLGAALFTLDRQLARAAVALDITLMQPVSDIQATP
jgi:predicted nucleic acid-binding protein